MTEPASKKFKLSTNLCTSTYFEKVNCLKSSFFDKPCIDLAKNLLGTILVRKLDNGIILKGKIVETECYLGNEDKASHSYNGRKTPRNEPMFMEPGTLYVYQTYGMYYCLNISSRGDGAAVLLRSVEPLYGIEEMSTNRLNYYEKRKKKSPNTNNKNRSIKIHELCNGPSKLCISFDINTETCNKKNLSEFPAMWLEEKMEDIDDCDIITSARVGIESAGSEWANKLLRFYLYGNQSVSIKDKKREKLKCEVMEDEKCLANR